jgi:nicotinamidase/pyrazinamidase
VIFLNDVIFWDVDTQIDFIEPVGKLYVSGAERLKDNIKLLTRLSGNRRICGSVDAHLPEDREFEIWPEHCVYGTPGQKKINESLLEDTLFIPPNKLTSNQLQEVIGFEGQLIFEKQSNDPRTNPNIRPILTEIEPTKVIVYGVVTEICVNLTVNYLVKDLGQNVIVAVDAIKEIDVKKASICRLKWEKMGVTLLKTNEIPNSIDKIF